MSNRCQHTSCNRSTRWGPEVAQITRGIRAESLNIAVHERRDGDGFYLPLTYILWIS